MLGEALREPWKKARYVANFLSRRLVHVNLQILYTCNFQCSICDFWKPPARDSSWITADGARRISEKLARIGPQIVSIGGGEPLVHPEIVDIVRALAPHHFPVMICNGWFATPEMAHSLWAAGMYEISVSVDYADPARHDRQRGRPGAFDRAIRALDTLRAERTRPDQRVHMISVIMEDNLDDVEPLIRLCREIGITYLVTLYSTGRGTREVRAVPRAVTDRLLDLKRRYPEFVVLRGYVERFERAVAESGIGPCQAGRNLCNIDSQGNVSLCIDRLDASIGNIFRDDIRAIERRLLDAHRANTCRACWTSCRGSIETLLYGGRRLDNILDYYGMTRPIRLDPARRTAPPTEAGIREAVGAVASTS